jgi:hypothetical protein
MTLIGADSMTDEFMKFMKSQGYIFKTVKGKITHEPKNKKR